MECLNNKGIGETCKQKTPITIVRALFLTVPGFAFADATEFASKADWLDYIAAGSIIPLQGVREEEGQDFEDPVIETTAGEKIDTFEGQRGARYKLLYPLDQHKLVRLLNDGNFGVILGDRNNNLRGTKLDDGTITGFNLSYFKVWKQDRPSAENAPYTMIDLQEEDPDEWDKSGVYLTPTWRVSRINGILQVVLTTGTIAAGVFTANVDYVDNSSFNPDGSAISRGINGAVDANFRIYNQAGALLTPTTDYTATPVTGVDGEYSIDTTVGTPITGGTCQVVAAADFLYGSEIETLS